MCDKSMKTTNLLLSTFSAQPEPHGFDPEIEKFLHK